MLIDVTFTGVKPILFDRYPGDNKTVLDPKDKLYLSTEGKLYVPALNVFSMLIAENTKSVCRQFHGRQGKTIGLAIGGNLSISPFEIPLLGANGEPLAWTGEWTEQIRLRSDVARVKGGIPNPKLRPEVGLPWSLKFRAEWLDSEDCSFETLKRTFKLAEKLGLGTFRPFFGVFEMTQFEVVN